MKKERKIIIHECNRCGYQWPGRGEVEEPKQCPGCKSAYWNKKRVRAKG